MGLCCGKTLLEDEEPCINTQINTAQDVSEDDQIIQQSCEPELVQPEMGPTEVPSNESIEAVPRPHVAGNNYLFRPLHPAMPEFQYIRRMIVQRCIIVDTIHKVSNPFLENAFLLKKSEKSLTYPDIQEVLMFHGTNLHSVISICCFNFDLRLVDKSKYGRGINFTPSAKYASEYPPARDSYNRVLIVARVLVGRPCGGHPNMILPPHGFDTAQKTVEDNIVTVKFEDSEFCPAYVVGYHFDDPMTMNFGVNGRQF